jgi:hypothetical protein
MDKRAVGKANEQAILQTIASWGWVTAALAGDLTWPNRPENSRRTQARVVLKRLEIRRLVRARQTRNAAAFVLTRKGAEYLNTILESAGEVPWAHHGNDLGVLDYRRHWLAMRHVVKQLESGCAGAMGPALLRASERYGKVSVDADAAYVVQRGENDYNLVAVLAVTNAREPVQEKYVALMRKCAVELAGDIEVVRTFLKRVAKRQPSTTVP